MKGWPMEARQQTEHAFRGGRFHTGDIGYLDEDGFLRLVDRKKDMINSGGFKIFPRTVEDAILEYPGVAEVAITSAFPQARSRSGGESVHRAGAGSTRAGLPDAARVSRRRARRLRDPGHDRVLSVAAADASRESLQDDLARRGDGEAELNRIESQTVSNT